MLVHAFFDGSWDSNDGGEPQVLTLACICATVTAWQRFNVKWSELLEKHNLSETGLHMTEMWNNSSDDRRRDIVVDAADSMQALHPDVQSTVCSIDMRDYRRLKAENPSLIHPESICVERTFVHLGTERGEELRPHSVSLYFDRSEGFLKKIYRVWEKRKRQRIGWPSQITTIAKVSSREHYSMQAVDMLAWLDHRQRVTGDVETHRMFVGFSAGICTFEFFDYDAMKARPKLFRESAQWH